MAIFQRELTLTGRRMLGYEKFRFSINIALHLGNNTRQGHSYYGMRIGNRIQALERYHFQ